MKKILLALGLLWSACASAQFTPGQLLTASELNAQFALYAPLAGATFTGSVAANAGLTASVITGTPVSGSSGSFTTLAASGSVSGAGFTSLLSPYALLASPTFTGTVTIPNLTVTGTTTLPTGSLPLSNLATQAANTIVANAAGSTASPTAIATPSCSTASSALQWASGSGLVCNSAINAASLGGATFASPGSIGSSTAGTGAFTSLSSTGTFTPSQTNGIVGTTTNNNANAGSVGEFISNTASGVSLTNNVIANITSISLTAGDWDVSGTISYSPAATTTVTGLAGGVSQTSATFDTQTFSYNWTFATGTVQTVTAPVARYSLSTTTTIYMVARSSFGTSTMTAGGFIRARRVR